MVPNTCTGGVNPLLKYTVYHNGALLGYKWYYDQFHYPYLIKEADYASRDVFEVTVLWDWKGYQANDYTIKVYSRQREIQLFDEKFETNMIHMDGQEPSGFTKSKYRSQGI